MIGNHTYYPEEKMLHARIPYIMGTGFEMILIGKEEEESESIWDSVRSILVDIDCRMNRFSPESEVYKVNMKLGYERVRISDELATAIRLCVSYHDRTSGLFDITRKDITCLRLDDNILESTSPDLMLDFGGFAKGFALQFIHDLLRAEGVDTAFVDFGGSSILALGTHPYGDCWKVRMRDMMNPVEFMLKDCAMSVSGNIVGYSGHIINPKTGESVDSAAVAVVVGHDVLDAEILSTVMMIADDRQKKDIKDKFPTMDIKILS